MQPARSDAPRYLRAWEGPAPAALEDLLVALIGVLRAGPDPAPLRVAERLVDTISSMSDDRRAYLARVTEPQRAALLAQLEAGPRATERDRGILLGSLAAAVAVVGDWSAGPLPPLERVALSYSAADLAGLVAGSAGAFDQLAAAREIELAVRVPDTLSAFVDQEKVERMVLNLLFNAFKATPVGGFIRVLLEVEEAVGEAVLRVVDSGAGVPVHMREAIFSRHDRADRGGPVTDGWLGFDLGASRDYMALHGGGLRLMPRSPGAGAAFVAHLPLAPPDGTPTGDPVGSQGLPARVAQVAGDELQLEAKLGDGSAVRGDRPVVLVIEDSRVMQRVVAGSLAPACDIVAALDGLTGLRLAEELRPDLIITDLCLPGLDGARLVRALRRRPRLETVPILVLSGRRDPAETVRLLRDGVQDVMGKPFRVAELAARAHNLLQAKRARDLLGGLLGERETDLGQMAAEVKRKQERLQAALEQLEQAREHAEAASRVKSNFLRMMSHELKTPVTALLLQMQIVGQEPAVVDGPDSVRRGFASMDRSVQRMLHIVDTVLEWARVESGRFRAEPQRFELAEPLRSAVDAVRPMAEAKGLAIELDVAAGKVVTDARLLELIVINLLARAVAVSNAGTIEVIGAGSADGHRVAVIDQGLELTAEERRELMDPFDPARDLRATTGVGSGLGLAVVRDLAGAIGGELSYLSNRPGGGQGVAVTFNDQE